MLNESSLYFLRTTYIRDVNFLICRFQFVSFLWEGVVFVILLSSKRVRYSAKVAIIAISSHFLSQMPSASRNSLFFSIKWVLYFPVLKSGVSMIRSRNRMVVLTPVILYLREERRAPARQLHALEWPRQLRLQRHGEHGQRAVGLAQARD